MRRIMRSSATSSVSVSVSVSMVVAGDLGSPDPSSSSLGLGGRDTDWGQLPQSLLEEVLRRLPVAAQLRFRSVSKCWLGILTSPGFLWDCVPREPAPAAILALGARFVLEERVEQPYPLPTPLCFYGLPPLQGPLARVDLCASHGGLVCIFRFRQCRPPPGGGFFVLNPMTRSWRKLPAGPANPSTMALRVDDASKAYTVVVGGAASLIRGADSSFYMYEASTDKWEDVGPIRYGLQCLDTVFFGEVAYFLGSELDVVGWNVKSREWESKILPPPAEFDTGRLLSHRGELLMIALYTCASKRYGIWRLLPDGVWGQVALLSDSSFGDFFPNLAAPSRGHVWCVLSFGETVCLDLLLDEHVFPEEEEEVESKTVRRRVLLAFDFSIRAWFVMPLQFLNSLSSTDSLLSFQPRLDSIV